MERYSRCKSTLPQTRNIEYQNHHIVHLQFFCPRWGSEQLSWEDFMIKVKSAGYDGIEYAIAADTDTRTLDHVWNLAERNQLLLIPQHYDTNSADFSQHYDEYGGWL